ncbi:MAG: phage holin family protein [Steroidobacteraceae bacterium]
MTRFALRATIAALGLWLATLLVSGLSIVDPLTLVFAALLLGVCNAVVKPVLILLTLPATILTLGLFLLVINGAVLALVAWVLPGFSIAGFGSAVLGALIVSITGMIGSLVFK